MLFALAIVTTVTLTAAQPCPSKCIRPRSEAVRQCREVALGSLCKVKQCPGRRGWKCNKVPQPKVRCSPVVEFAFNNCGRGPLCETIEELPENERSMEIGCKCEGRTTFSSEDKIVASGLKNKDFKCYLNCMKTSACRRRACTADPGSGAEFDPCSDKQRIFSQNVRNRRSQRGCCEGCGFSYILRTAPGHRNEFVCTAA